MLVKQREFYSSSNGDRWHLVREPRSGRVFIRHEPNAASGGDTDLVEINEFLAQQRGPQHDELLRLIGTLVDGPSDAKAPEARGAPPT